MNAYLTLFLLGLIALPALQRRADRANRALLEAIRQHAPALAALAFPSAGNQASSQVTSHDVSNISLVIFYGSLGKALSRNPNTASKLRAVRFFNLVMIAGSLLLPIVFLVGLTA